MDNPFHYPGPTTPDAFHGRARELGWIGANIGGAEPAPVVVTSDARLGVTSLLRKLEALAPRLGGAVRIEPAYVDVESLADAGPAALWEAAVAGGAESLRPALGGGDDAVIAALAAAAAAGTRVLLLLDGLDGVLTRPSLVAAAGLLSAPAPGLAVVVGTRLEPTELDARLAGPLDHKPWLAGYRSLTLDGWTPLDVRTLIKRAGPMFDAPDVNFLSDLVGGVPLLLNLAGVALWESRIDVLPSRTVDLRSSADVREEAAKVIHQRSTAVVSDLLARLLPPDRAALIYLGMSEIGLRVAAPVPQPRVFGHDTEPLVLPAIGELLSDFNLDDLHRIATAVGGTNYAAGLKPGDAAKVSASLTTAIMRADLARQTLETLYGLYPDRRAAVRSAARVCGIPLRADPVRPPDYAALLQRGLLASPRAGTWALRAGLIRWWVADALAEICRGEIGLARWLEQQGIDELWTPGALAACDEEMAIAAPRLRKGAALLVRSTARSAKA